MPESSVEKRQPSSNRAVADWSAGLDMGRRALRPLPTDKATADYMELLNRANVEPRVAIAYQEFLKLGLPVIVPHTDVEGTERTGHGVLHYKINEILMELLIAARAAESEHG